MFEPIFKSGITGSVIDEITPEFIKKLRIPVPNDLKTQKRIGKPILDAEQNISMATDLFSNAESKLNSYFK